LASESPNENDEINALFVDTSLCLPIGVNLAVSVIVFAVVLNPIFINIF
jgi:hypothetical protein